jgi:hypothetical protein
VGRCLKGDSQFGNNPSVKRDEGEETKIKNKEGDEESASESE